VSTFDPVKCPQAIEYQGATPVLVFHPKFVVQALHNYPANRPRIKASCTKSVSKYKRGGMPSKPYVATRLQARAVVAAHALAPQNVAGRGQLHAWSHLTGHDLKTVAPLSLGTRLHSKYWLLRERCWSAAQHPPGDRHFYKTSTSTGGCLKMRSKPSQHLFVLLVNSRLQLGS
jgi:hypothetical protein